MPDPGGEPPRPGENRRILDSLRDSIDIRRDIEGTPSACPDGGAFAVHAAGGISAGIGPARARPPARAHGAAISPTVKVASVLASAGLVAAAFAIGGGVPSRRRRSPMAPPGPPTTPE